MSDRALKLLLIDQDPIFRLGLRVSLEEIPHLQVLESVDTDVAALQVLAELTKQDSTAVNLVVLELGNGQSSSSQQQGLQLCRQLKTHYPNLPILLLSSVQEPSLLLAARTVGVDGYCPKGIPVSEIVTAMQAVAVGGSYWFGEIERTEEGEIQNSKYPAGSRPPGVYKIQNAKSVRLPFARLRNNLHSSGIGYIEATLAQVTAQLQVPGLPLLDKTILTGHYRELLAARWLLNRVLASPQERQEYQQQISEQLPPVANSSLTSMITSNNSQSLLSPKALQSSLFDSCINKLKFPLQNLTDVPLEIDIFSEAKKRELLYLILQKLTKILDEMRISQVENYQLAEFKNTILLDLWQSSLTDFFGKFSRVRVSEIDALRSGGDSAERSDFDNRNLEIVNLLLQDAEFVQIEILNKIPLFVDLLSYLLFKTDLQLDNLSYPAGSSEADSQAAIILENLLIHVANGIVQPLLNRFADITAIKQSFYKRQFLSTRQIESFRNDLSWKYRLKNYITEPKAIFESRYEMFVFAPRGIAQVSIYAPRSEELAQLSGIGLVVTLVLEFRDAIAPRLQTLLALLGSGIVFILTQVIGRGFGLIARGILQGIGSVSLPEKNLRRNSERPK